MRILLALLIVATSTNGQQPRPPNVGQCMSAYNTYAHIVDCVLNKSVICTDTNTYRLSNARLINYDNACCSVPA